MCGNTEAETLRAVLGNLKNHDFTVFPKFTVEDYEGKVLLKALEDYKAMCEAHEFYHVPFPDAVFNSNTVI